VDTGAWKGKEYCLSAFSESKGAHSGKKLGIQKIGDSNLAPQVCFVILIVFFTNVFSKFVTNLLHYVVGYYRSCRLDDEEFSLLL